MLLIANKAENANPALAEPDFHNYLYI